MEELGGVPHFLKAKTILVTGAAGFLAKVFVEKLLRTQSDIKKLYLLLRASDADAARKRLHDEIVGKDLFKILREKWGKDFDSFISKKVTALAGDVSAVNLGIKDANLQTKLTEEIDVIVNLAATTNFDERMDIAMGVNTMGALHVLNFAKRCHKLNLFLHISTAYVCGETKNGKVIKEEAFEMGQTLNGTSKFEINTEKNLMHTKIEELKAKNVDGRAISSALKDYGIHRAKLYGWPNTYVFTKAMGEMLLSHFKENIPLIIIRPTMVTSTYKEPFPGWIEGFRTLDAIIGGYGKGKIKCFMGHPNTILDLIPADMVINCMMAAMMNHSNKSANLGQNYIYHVGSSSRNTLRAASLQETLYLYFTKCPWNNKFNRKPVIISRLKLLRSMPSFHRYLMIRCVLPLKGLNLVNKMFCRGCQDVYSRSCKKIEMVIRMAELYKPYAFFKDIFDDTNTEDLRMETNKEVEFDDLEFDPKSIDWTKYMMNVHIPGLIKYVVK